MQTTLARKFILAALGVVCVVLVGSATIAVRRERLLFEQDMAHDAQVLVAALLDPFLAAWRTEGWPAARGLLRRAESSTGAVRIGWRALGAIQPAEAARLARAALDRPLAATSWRELEPRPGYLVTAVRADSPDGTPGAVLVAESLADERGYVAVSVRNHVLTLVILLLLAAAGMWFVGQHFVGVPVALLVAKARRAGAGDLGGPVLLAQRDELGELAGEMNEMCARLAEARRQAAEETEARLRTVEQLRHVERLGTVGRLASGVAHELGTPLNVALARAGLIRSAGVSQEARDHVAAIERQIERMTRIIRGLLDFARPSGSGSHRARVDARQVAATAAAMLRAMADRAGVIVAVEEGAPVELDADEGQLQQVLTNLMLNAIQAGGAVRVTFGAAAPTGPGGERPPARAVVVTVADDGPGMPDEVRRRVFEPFFTTKPIGQGTGLGLAVSLGIVQDHGGYIAVASAPGQGTSFSVVLPG